MKKLLYLLIAVSLMLALVPTMALAHYENDPLVVDLLAGQTEDIGDVKVWNDADTLYVQFLYTGPDCGFLEVHLQVDEGAFSDDILTKKGNPIPGQFEMSHKPGTCFPEKTFTYDLDAEGFDCNETLVIAAHAATGLEEQIWVYSDGNESFTAYTGPGTTSYPCEQGDPRPGTAVPAWQHSAWISDVNPQFTYGTWVWESEYSVNPICGDVVDFDETFAVAGLPNGGTLWVTADNGYEAYLNTNFLGSDGLSGDWRNSDLRESYVTTARSAWSSVESYDLTDWLVQGDNTFHFPTANEYFNTDDGHGSPGTTSSNPGGLIYEAEINYYADGETAWGCGTDPEDPNCEDFDGRNWATYFNYTVQCCTNVPVVVNGGFEEPVPTTSQGWDIYDSGTEGLGWTVEWYDGSTSYGGQTRPEPAHLELHTSGTVVDAYEDNQYAELDTDWDGPGGGLNDEPASVRIYQDLDTCPGASYTLHFAWAPRPGYTSKLQVYWDGDPLGPFEGGSDWQQAEFTVPASGTSTRLEFVETGPPDSFRMFLDDVSVTESP